MVVIGFRLSLPRGLTTIASRAASGDSGEADWRWVATMADLPETGPKLRLGRRFLPLVAAASAGVAVAVSAWLAVSVWEERLAEVAFTNVAGDYATVLQNGLDDYVDKLVDVRAFYDASVEVDPDEFKLFTGRILEGVAPRMRITWSPRVTGNERAAFEVKADRSGLEGYKIKTWAPDGVMPPAPQGEEYFPILYATNVPKGALPFGVDIKSEPMRGETLERALDEDRMAAALDIVLSDQGKDDRNGFFVALPVYRRGLPRATVAERRQNVLGILGATFPTKTILDAILKGAGLPQNVDLYLYPAQAGAAPVYLRASPLHRTPLKPMSLAELEKAPHWSGALKVGDASWNLVVTPTKGGLTSFYRAWIVLVIVALVFGAVLAYMLATVRNALRLEHVNRRVVELARTDLLTSLANRRGFLKRLSAAFAASSRTAPPFAVLYLDIDDFKDVNDTLGHPMGDALLKQVVERLKRVVKDEDLVARFGGDEFAILQTRRDRSGDGRRARDHDRQGARQVLRRRRPSGAHHLEHRHLLVHAGACRSRDHDGASRPRAL